MKQYLLAFVPIFVAVDALGIIPVFLSLTQGVGRAERRKLILDSTVTALVVAVAFLWIGRHVFKWLGISISDFMVAGGAVLFIISIRDLLKFGKSVPNPGESVGVVPLAVPLIVGPAVLATSLILLSSQGLYPTLFSLVANILLCGVILFFAESLSRVFGEAGSNTISKIASLLLAAIGVMMIRRGMGDIIGSVVGNLKP